MSDNTTQDLINDLRDAAKCIYIVAEEDIAFDISEKLRRSVDLILYYDDNIRRVITDLEAKGNFLNTPHDHPTDRAVGMAYTECAEILRKILEKNL